MSNQRYETPWWFIRAVQEEFCIGDFDVDVCADESNSKSCLWIDEDMDALINSWLMPLSDSSRGVLFWCNPPYTDVMPWVEAAWGQIDQSPDQCFMLLKNDSSTKWYARAVELADEMYVITHKRISFLNDGKRDPGSNFDNLLVRFRHKNLDRPARLYHWNPFETGAYHMREDNE